MLGLGDSSEERRLERLYPVWWTCQPNGVLHFRRAAQQKHAVLPDGHPIPPRWRHQLDNLIFKLSLQEEDEIDLDEEFDFAEILGRVRNPDEVSIFPQGSFGEVWRVNFKGTEKTEDHSRARRRVGNHGESNVGPPNPPRKSLLAPSVDTTRVVEKPDGAWALEGAQMRTNEENALDESISPCSIVRTKNVSRRNGALGQNFTHQQSLALKLVPYR